MATRPEAVEHLLDTLSDLRLSARAMFGEYALYLDGMVVALVCDDQLWIKPTPGVAAALPDCEQGHPFPGSSLYLCVTDALDDAEQVTLALRAVARERPPPKPRRKKKTDG